MWARSITVPPLAYMKVSFSDDELKGVACVFNALPRLGDLARSIELRHQHVDLLLGCRHPLEGDPLVLASIHSFRHKVTITKSCRRTQAPGEAVSELMM